MVRTGEMARVMAEGGRDVATALQARVDEISQAITAKTNTIAETLSSKAEQIGQSLDGRIASINELLGNRADEISETLGARAFEINQILGNRAEEIAAALDQSVTMLEDRVVNRLTGVAETIDERGQTVLGSLTSRIGEIRSIFDTEGATLLESLGRRGDVIGREVAAISETTLRDLEERSNAVIGSLQDRSSSMLLVAPGAHDGAHRRLSAIDTGRAQRPRRRHRADGRGAHRRQREPARRAHDVLGRLNDANRLLQQVAASASGNLGAVEEGLAGRVQHIEALLSEIATQTGRASDQVADQVDALRSVSSGAIQQALELAQSLEERGRALTETPASRCAPSPKPPRPWSVSRRA